MFKIEFKELSNLENLKNYQIGENPAISSEYPANIAMLSDWVTEHYFETVVVRNFLNLLILLSINESKDFNEIYTSFIIIFMGFWERLFNRNFGDITKTSERERIGIILCHLITILIMILSLHKRFNSKLKTFMIVVITSYTITQF
jgi:hypothetical protein